MINKDSTNELYWFYNPEFRTIGIEYEESRDFFWTVHETQSSSHSPTIFSLDYVGDTVCVIIDTLCLSEINPGWPWQLDNRTGIDVMPNGNLLLPDYNGDLSYADDNIVEIRPDGTIVNAWEMDDEVGSNDSRDNSEIDSIIDIAVIAANDDSIHAFVTAAYDDWRVYEIVLFRTGEWWTPNSWYTLSVDSNLGFSEKDDNLGIDVIGDTVVISSWDHLRADFYDVNFNFIDSLRMYGEHNGGYHSGICFIPTNDTLQAGATDFSSDLSAVHNTNFILNSPPEISDIPDQTGQENSDIGPLDFSVFDTQTDAYSLIVTASSNNQTLIPDANISLGGSGEDRSITLTPAADQSGEAVITVTVEDGGGLTASDEFDVTIYATASNIYIDPAAGEDDGARDGSSSEPFATLSYAEFRASDGDTLNLSGTLTADGIATDHKGVEITKNLLIRGEAADQTVMQGHSSSASSSDRRCLTIAAGNSVTVRDMTLRYGNGGTTGGGAVLNNGSLTIENCIITDNITTGASNYGGGIYNSGVLSVINSTVKNNTSGASGGGIYSAQDITVKKSTISGNTAASDGGALVYSASDDNLNLTLTNCTISANTATSGNGGGLHISAGGAYTAAATITNATIANNTCGGSGNGIYEETTAASATVSSAYTNTILDNTGSSGNYAQSGSGTHNLSRNYSICRDASMPAAGTGNQNNTEYRPWTTGR
ncbi:MAG: right-handed parallel beta-helix repeat-containing protein [candidate division KSB1 bacterium]|nr:right-handed parallel beta-helix repeat-containing protein [candidate division KSB1 bacterium]